MPPISSKELNDLQGKCRFHLLLSMIFFMISLFSLVSRWTIAFPMIVFSCAFSLLTSRLNKRRYAEALTQCLTAYAAQQADIAFSSYTASESLDQIRASLGFTPDTSYIGGSKAHHVLHGSLNEKPFFMGEAALLRKNIQGNTCSVAGTIASLQNILPPSEDWVILQKEPFSHFCPTDEYTQNGYVSVPSASESLAVWRASSGTDELLPAVVSFMASNPCDFPLVAAAHNGALSIFEIGAFYAPTKVDYTKPFSDSDLKSVQVSAITLIRQTIEKLVI